MDRGWVNIHGLNHGSTDQPTTSSAQPSADLTGGNSGYSSSLDTQSNSNGDNDAAIKARNKSYKDKNRQKDADKKKLLELKVSLYESEAKLYKQKWDHVKSSIPAGSSASSCACCHAWLQQVLTTADNMDADEPIEKKRLELEEHCKDFKDNYGGLSTTCRQSGKHKDTSSTIMPHEPTSKKPRTTAASARWKYCPWCRLELCRHVRDVADTYEPVDSNQQAVNRCLICRCKAHRPPSLASQHTACSRSVKIRQRLDQWCQWGPHNLVLLTILADIRSNRPRLQCTRRLDRKT